MVSADMANQKKAGILLSYLGTISSALINIVLIPYLISKLGPAEYGVYKIMHSFAGYLLLMDLGVGTILTRFVSLYEAKQEREKVDRCVATGFAVCILLSVIVALAGYALEGQIGPLYENTLTAGQLQLAHQLFRLLVLNVEVSLFQHFVMGYISAFEKFFVAKGLLFLQIVFRFILTVVLVSLFQSALVVALVELSFNAATLLIAIWYARSKLGMRIDFRKFDRSLISQYFLFSAAILFQSIVNQVNNSVDNMILGAMVSPEIVTMYSSGLTVYGLYVSLPEAVNQVFLPQATRDFGERLEEDGIALTDFVVRIGRYEAILCIAILSGFLFIGRDFVQLWIGQENMGAWGVALLLMIPVTIPMCQNVMVTVLNARNKRLFRSVILAAVALLNIAVTIALIPRLGYIGAAVGTFLSILLGHGIMLNVYYHKAFHLRIFDMFKRVYGRSIPCGAAAYGLSCGLTFWIGGVSWAKLILKGCIFGGIYLLLIFRFFLTEKEKETWLSLLPFSRVKRRP